MKSMTGYGFAESVNEECSIYCEIKSYNSRYLEIETNLPSGWGKYEAKIREIISERNARGKIEVFVKLKKFSEEIEINVNESAIKSSLTALQKVISLAGLDESIHLSHLLRIEGLLKTYSLNQVDKLWPHFEVVFYQSLKQFEESRIIEGEKIQKSLLDLARNFKLEIENITSNESVLRHKIEEYVKQRFNEVLGNIVEEDRVLQEIASLLLKTDINEEIIRLKAHLSALEVLLKDNQAVGKKLDFICQELNREINTIGTKSFVYEVNKAVINAKEIIERIRELSRNVE